MWEEYYRYKYGDMSPAERHEFIWKMVLEELSEERLERNNRRLAEEK